MSSSVPTSLNVFDLAKKTMLNSSAEPETVPNLTGVCLKDRYRVYALMSNRGGEADLYHARDPDGGEWVIKLYRRRNALKEEIVSRLLGRRFQNLAFLADCGDYRNFQYTVTPFYEGSSLEEILAKGVRLSEDEIRSMLSDLAGAVHTLHGLDIIHKDLKPANIIISKEGLILTDFGISTDLAGRTSVITYTGRSLIYSAPETAGGVFLRESDYYSLGITIYEAFTGSSPFADYGLSDQELCSLVAVQSINFPENFPGRLKNLIRGLTYRDLTRRSEPDNPNRRWGHDEIMRWLRGEDVPVPGYADCADDTAEDGHFRIPYSFKGVKIFTASELARALLSDPENGKKEVQRGILERHCDANGLQDLRHLCELSGTAMENFPKSADQHFFRLVYGLDRGISFFCWGDLFFETFDAYGRALLGEASRFEKYRSSLTASRGTSGSGSSNISGGDGSSVSSGICESGSPLQSSGNQPSSCVYEPDLNLLRSVFAVLGTDLNSLYQRGRVFENQSEILPGDQERKNFACSELISAFLDPDKKSCEFSDPEMISELRKISASGNLPDFKRNPESFEVFMNLVRSLGYCLSDDTSFSFNGESFDSLSSFSEKMSVLRSSDPVAFTDFLSSSYRDLRTLRSLFPGRCLRLFARFCPEDGGAVVLHTSDRSPSVFPLYSSCSEVNVASELSASHENRTGGSRAFQGLSSASAPGKYSGCVSDGSFGCVRIHEFVFNDLNDVFRYQDQLWKDRNYQKLYLFRESTRDDYQKLFSGSGDSPAGAGEVSDPLLFHECEKRCRGMICIAGRVYSDINALSDYFRRISADRRMKSEFEKSGADDLLRLYRSTDSEDVRRLLEENFKYVVRPYLKLKPGDTIRFGDYCYDSESSMKHVLWRVLAVEKDRALLTAVYAVTTLKYHTEEVNVTWSESYIRRWLNQEFLVSCFSKDEQKFILKAKIRNNAGDDTEDRIFLLSTEEADRYFRDDDDRRCRPSPLCRNRKAWTEEGCCWYWLRSAGVNQNRAAGVDTYGGIYKEGSLVDLDYGSVRPAFYLDLGQ